MSNAMNAASGASAQGAPSGFINYSGGSHGNGAPLCGGAQMGVGVPVYTNPSGNFTTSLGVGTNFQHVGNHGNFGGHSFGANATWKF